MSRLSMTPIGQPFSREVRSVLYQCIGIRTILKRSVRWTWDGRYLLEPESGILGLNEVVQSS